MPIRRTFGDVTVPRVHAGRIHVAVTRGPDRIRVIVGLKLPPLAAAFGRSLAGEVATRRLDVHSVASREYVARVDAVQRRAVVELRRAIPQAQVQERFQVVLDGITVELPASKLATLTSLGFVDKVYPSVRYTVDTNRSPSVIAADALQAATGAKGDGMKIGIVDEGVDYRNPFFDPSSFSYPSGFPKGSTKYTTPKIIVARVFPGPTSTAAERVPFDPAADHGTHVAGIAAGDSGTCAPADPNHPAVCGLSGIAPRAQIGSYRVFTTPISTPFGIELVADTPETIAGFEAAVDDGMNVINFSAGAPETEPANDALVDAVENIAAAGVVPVIAAGNDREMFGLGTVGSPGTAPDAITVAATSNLHVFSPTMAVQAQDAPDSVTGIPVAEDTLAAFFPSEFGLVAHELVDIGTLTATGGGAVDRRLCGPDNDPNNAAKTPLAAGSLRGVIALVSRGHCSFDSKAQRAKAAGAIGILVVDNRSGEADPIPEALPIPGAMIADLDGANLRTYLDAHNGTAPVVIGSAIQEVETGRSGIITDFSSAGLTDFQDILKPDISAVGAQVLSSVPPESNDGSPFAVFSGTSMATPAVAGSAALLLELHPSWTPQEVKSALMSTAGPAWADTPRTVEAPVTLEGGGLVNLVRAASPLVLTDPASLSFRDLDVTHGAQTKGMLVRVTDAGNGAGTWTITLDPQSATAGASLDLPGQVDIPPGGEGDFAAVAAASAGATQGEDYGFIVLHKGSDTRRIPYAFVVAKPVLATMDATQIKPRETGSTAGQSRVSVYCCPSEPFGPPPDYVGPPMDESGSEHLYSWLVKRPLVNIGVSVMEESAGALVDPWFLGSKDENDVQGYAGTPVNQNELMFDYLADIGAAGSSFPRQQQFYVAVDSGSDPFTHQGFPGSYVLRFWQNDLKPPSARVLTKRVAAGRPTIVARALDTQSGVDPLSLSIGYRGVIVGAAAYDPVTGLAVFPLPADAARIPVGKTKAFFEVSDFQESKNLNTIGNNPMPNTRVESVTFRAVAGPVVTWLEPVSGRCVATTASLAVAASSTSAVRSVRFSVDGRRVAVDRKGVVGLFTTTWHVGSTSHGRHVLKALATDARGRHVSATRSIRVCS